MPTFFATCKTVSVALRRRKITALVALAAEGRSSQAMCGGPTGKCRYGATQVIAVLSGPGVFIGPPQPIRAARAIARPDCDPGFVQDDFEPHARRSRFDA